MLWSLNKKYCIVGHRPLQAYSKFHSKGVRITRKKYNNEKVEMLASEIYDILLAA